MAGPGSDERGSTGSGAESVPDGGVPLAGEPAFDGLVARTLVVTTLLLLAATLILVLSVFLLATLTDSPVVVYTDQFGERGVEMALLYVVVTPVVSVGLALITYRLERSH
jgi:hypothetical protein